VIENLKEIFGFAIIAIQSRNNCKPFKDRRLMGLVQNEKPSRAFYDLRRIFYRALSELRKHQ